MAASLTFSQVDFSGGMNQQVDGSRVGLTEYPLLLNARTRNGIVEPVTRPIDRTPTDLTWFQGVYAAGSYSVIFASGQAFYKDETLATSEYTRIPGLQLSTTARFIYACAVPASTVNARRTLTDQNNINLGVKFIADTSSSPQCLVVQDGTSQPWIIFPDGSARVTQNYNQWLTTNREYVPIGSQMLFAGGILYVVSSDGKQIFRSVTGRPLDFMVIIAPNGDKLASESDGGAAQISHKVDYAPITAIGTLNSADDSFYVSTARTSYSVRPNFDITPYGEPSFDNVFLFSTGATNQFSLCDVLGDIALVDYSGIRSFNSVRQFRVDGKNSPFSARINALLDGQTQTSAAAVAFDNYAIFAVRTVFGEGFLVYDTILQQWAALDLHEEFSSRPVLMFAEVKTNTTRKLLCITRTGLFELYSSSGTTHVAGYYTPEFCSGQSAIRQKPLHVKLTFVDVRTAGNVFVLPYEDSKAGVQKASAVAARLISRNSYVPPIVNGTSDQVRNVLVPLNDTSKVCWKCGLFVRWNFSGKLAAITLESNTETANNAYESQMNTAETLLAITALSYSFGTPVNSTIHIFGSGFANATSVIINGVTHTNITIHHDGWLSVQVDSSWEPVLVITSVTVITVDGDDIVDRFDWVIDPCTGLGNNRDIVVLPLSAVPITDSTGASNPASYVVSQVNAWIEANRPAKRFVPLCGESVDDPPPVFVVDPPTPPPDGGGDEDGGGDDVIVETPPPDCCNISLNSDTQPVSSAQPATFVLDITGCYNSLAGNDAAFAGFMFKKQADGTFTFVTPLLSSTDSVAVFTDSPKTMANLGKTFSAADGTIMLDLGNVNICINLTDDSVTDDGGDPDPEPICEDCPLSVTLTITGYPTVDSPTGNHYLPIIARVGDTCRYMYDGGGYVVDVQKINGKWNISVVGSNPGDSWSGTWEGTIAAECPAGFYDNGTGTCEVTT